MDSPIILVHGEFQSAGTWDLVVPALQNPGRDVIVVPLTGLEPGDVLVIANTYRRGLSHTGIYIGEGQFVHAANERHGVTVSNLWDGYWGPRFAGASRPAAATA